MTGNGDYLFLPSKVILDYKEFSNVENNNWDESPLKKWLNREFLDGARCFYWLRSANKNLTKADLANPLQKATPGSLRLPRHQFRRHKRL